MTTATPRTIARRWRRRKYRVKMYWKSVRDEQRAMAASGRLYE